MIREFCMFAGYGGSVFALKKANIPHELVGFSEIDKYAIQCFIQNHITNNSHLLHMEVVNGGLDIAIAVPKNWGDCRTINPNELPDFDLLTGGFPCQAFSNAGKMQGEADQRGTLFYEIIRIAEVKKPKYMLLENVKGLTSKKFKDTFNKILSELDRIGYNVYWKVLNSKDYGIPQSRARIWFVCFRKDIDKGTFKFPEQEELKIRLKDLLE
jgi:DNA (cytosine-5)-methyltransferase 1